jgi:hypothetical protein
MKKRVVLFALLAACILMAGAAAPLVNKLIEADPPTTTLVGQEMMVTPLDPLLSETAYTARVQVVVTSTYEVDQVIRLAK